MKALRLIRYTLAIAILSVILAAQALATCFLRQSDAAEVPIGQFVDATDGVTAETGLTISQADVMLKKCAAGGDCGAMAQKNDSSACAHDALGVYECDLNATDTDTVGTLFIYVNESGALTEKLVCQVLDTAPFDADYADAATGRRDANVTAYGGTNGTFSSGRPETNTTHWGGTAVASARPLVDTVQVSGDSGAADTLETWLDGTAGSAAPIGIVDQGTAQSATGTTLVLRAALAMGDDTSIGMTLMACGSTQGYCQSRTVTDYVSATDTATVDTWTVTPSGTITYYLFATAPGTAGSPPTAAAIADAVWDESTSGHTTSGTFGEQLKTDIDDILVDTSTTLDDLVDDLESRLGTPSNHGSGATVAGNLNDIEGQTDDIGAAGAGLTAADDAVMTRLGSPAGASVSADVAAVKTETAAILDDTGTSGVQLPAGEITSSTFGSGAIDAAAVSADAGTEIATAVRSITVEDQGTISLGCAMAALLAVNAGDVATSGGNSTFEEHTGAETRVTSVIVSAGNRTVTITCPTY